MELDDLQKAWARYDRKLDKSLRFNEAMLRKTNLEKSERALGKSLFYEKFAIVTWLFTTVVMAVFAVKMAGDLAYSIPGFICAGTSAVLFIFAVLKARALLRVDFLDAPVVHVQKQVADLKHKVFRLKKIEMVLLPVWLVSAVPFVLRLYEVDVYANPVFFALATVIGLAAFMPLVRMEYRCRYDSKINRTERFLQEIESFAAEV